MFARAEANDKLQILVGTCISLKIRIQNVLSLSYWITWNEMSPRNQFTYLSPFFAQSYSCQRDDPTRGLF